MNPYQEYAVETKPDSPNTAVDAALVTSDGGLLAGDGDTVIPPKDVIEESTQSQHVEGEERKPTFLQQIYQFLLKYDFLVGLIVVIILAYAYPPLGAVYLAPDITASWIAVMYIFLISGLALRTEEFKSALGQVRFHAFIQMYNFFFISAVVFGLTRFLISTGVLVPTLGDGMTICSCLPMAINMVIILSQNADGDEGVAVFNSAFGNMLGVFLSPLLILGYLGVSGDVNLGTIFYKLVIRVLVPIVVGQLLQKFSKVVADFSYKHRAILSKTQMYALLFIVYTVFCDTFMTGTTIPATEFFFVLLLQVTLLLMFMVIAWYCLKFLFPTDPKLRVTGVYGCTFKTVSLGVPLINAMYEGSPNLAMYILPLLMWYPTQLAVGSILAPRFKSFVHRQKLELASQGIVVAQQQQEEEEEEEEEEFDNDDDDARAVVDVDATTMEGNVEMTLSASKQLSHGGSNNGVLYCPNGDESPVTIVDVESPPCTGNDNIKPSE